MPEKPKRSLTDIPKEMRMVNREYDEIVSKPNDSSSISGAKRSKNSKDK